MGLVSLEVPWAVWDWVEVLAITVAVTILIRSLASRHLVLLIPRQTLGPLQSAVVSFFIVSCLCGSGSLSSFTVT